MSQKNVRYVVDAKGHCEAVQLSVALWEHVKSAVLKADEKLSGPADDPFARPEPLDALAELKACWDFKYPYEGRVLCKACDAQTNDWEHDPARPFHLTNANFAGLMVFRCRACRATVRKKHFRDHVAFEFTLG